MRNTIAIAELGAESKYARYEAVIISDNDVEITQTKLGILPLLNIEFLKSLMDREKKGNSIIGIVLLDQLNRKKCQPMFSCLANKDSQTIQLDAMDRKKIIGPQLPTTGQDLHQTAFAKSYSFS